MGNKLCYCECKEQPATVQPQYPYVPQPTLSVKQQNPSVSSNDNMSHEGQKATPAQSKNDINSVRKYEAKLMLVQSIYGPYTQPSASKIREGVQYLDPSINDEGEMYIGEWKYGRKHGRGTQIWPDGSVYEGDWMQNELFGKGRLVIMSSAAMYSGEWANNKCNGYGRYENRHPQNANIPVASNTSPIFSVFNRQSNLMTQLSYEGNWKDNQPHGYGMIVGADGTTYRGEFVEGRKHGMGRMEWPDGRWYEGNFCQDSFEGEGTYKSLVGDVYTGSWRNNKKHGKGTNTFADGRKYVGEYKNDLKDGQGTFSWNNGLQQYKGGWKEDKQHGQGSYVNSKGQVFHGVWTMGTPPSKHTALRGDMASLD